MIGFSTALNGIQSSETNFNQAAARVANPAVSSNLPTDVVELQQAGINYEANLKAVDTTDQMTKAALDLLA